jgi:hypothetical protein
MRQSNAYRLDGVQLDQIEVGKHANLNMRLLVHILDKGVETTYLLRVHILKIHPHLPGRPIAKAQIRRGNLKVVAAVSWPSFALHSKPTSNAYSFLLASTGAAYLRKFMTAWSDPVVRVVEHP